MKWLNFFDGEPCTGFPNSWLQWRLPSRWWKLWQWWRVIDLSPCCEIHDEECSTKEFAKCMLKVKAVGSIIIVSIASVACIIKYGKA